VEGWPRPLISAFPCPLICSPILLSLPCSFTQYLRKERQQWWWGVGYCWGGRWWAGAVHASVIHAPPGANIPSFPSFLSFPRHLPFLCHFPFAMKWLLAVVGAPVSHSSRASARCIHPSGNCSQRRWEVPFGSVILVRWSHPRSTLRAVSRTHGGVLISLRSLCGAGARTWHLRSILQAAAYRHGMGAVVLSWRVSDMARVEGSGAAYSSTVPFCCLLHTAPCLLSITIASHRVLTGRRWIGWAWVCMMCFASVPFVKPSYGS
jgi:hypothetical protein